MLIDNTKKEKIKDLEKKTLIYIIMNLLCMLFAFLYKTKSNPKTKSNNPMLFCIPEYHGFDFRFPLENSHPDEFLRISMLHHSFGQLILLQQLYNKIHHQDRHAPFIHENWYNKNEDIKDILETDVIRPIAIKSGGLFDDWEMNI